MNTIITLWHRIPKPLRFLLWGFAQIPIGLVLTIASFTVLPLGYLIEAAVEAWQDFD